MNEKSFQIAINYFTGAISLLMLTILLWDYYHGGVPSHHLLANKDLPEVSNWWGAISIPLVTFLSLITIKNRLNYQKDFVGNTFFRKYLVPFLFGLVYALSLAISFSTGKSDISSLLFQGLFILALIFPLFRLEYYLGFVFGLTYTFGGVLPIFIGLIFVIISLVFHKILVPLVYKLPFLKSKRR
jgi:hypothetical protein